MDLLQNDLLKPDRPPVYKPVAVLGSSVGEQGKSSDFDLRREDHRLRSMDKWPLKVFMNVELAARNGLYYSGVEDTLRCHFCKVELKHWKLGDDASAEHARRSPECPFLRRKPVGNVPMSRDVCDGMEGVGRPAHVVYTTEEARLESFRDWPVRMRQTPEALAAAGFFYTGSGDHTVCYHCGGGLQDWEDNDDPWEQHARWFNRCPYLRAVKKEEYIRKVNAAGASVAPKPVFVPEPEAVPEASQDSQDTSKLCKICYDHPSNVCFVPCGHVVACVDCAASMSKCPICREPCVKMMKIFYS